MENKIKWEKPDYKNQFGKVSNKEVEYLCETRGGQTGDVIVQREQNGREIKFYVYRIEKVGILIEGIETLSRQRAIEELKKFNVKNKQKKKTSKRKKNEKQKINS